MTKDFYNNYYLHDEPIICQSDLYFDDENGIECHYIQDIFGFFNILIIPENNKVAVEMEYINSN